MRWLAKTGVVDDGAERLSSIDSFPTGGPIAAMRLVVTEEDRPLYLTAGANTEHWSRFLLPGLIAMLMIGAVLAMMVAPPLP